MQKITPFLFFDHNAEEAIDFYTSIFPDSSITKRSNFPEGSPGPVGQLMTATFRLHGQEFIALNGCVSFEFTEAISFTVTCESQEELDHYWDKLVEGGNPSQSGWLKDKFGVSWQIVPKGLGELLTDPDPEKSGRVMEAILQMVKLDVQKLHDAYDGK